MWRSDGTDAGTARVADIFPGPVSSTPTGMTDANGTVFFAAFEPNGIELWKSDGTAGGTQRVADISPGAASSAPANFVAAGSRVFFTADDGSGNHFWSSDGTGASTMKVLSAVPTQVRALGESVLFSEYDPQVGVELWASDGTPAGTGVLKDIDPGPGRSSPIAMGVFGGRLYFAATGPMTGQELWATDGTAAGTALVADLDTRPFDSPAPGSLTSFGGTLYFVANNSLFKRDASAGAIVRVTGLDMSSSGLAVLGDSLYFTAGSSASRHALWKVHGPTGGLSLVKHFPNGGNGITNLAAAGGKLYFAARTAGNTVGDELYVSDGTPVGTVRLPSNTGGSAYNPRGFTQVGGTVFFYATDGFDSASHGSELWATDGTPANSRMVKDIVPGPNSSIVGTNPPVLADVNGTLVFAAANNGTNYEPWRSDGTAAGTEIIRDLNGSTTNGTFQIDQIRPWKSLQVVNGVGYFIGSPESMLGGLWRTDGTSAGTFRIVPLFDGGDTNPANTLTRVGNRLFFVKQNGGIHNEYVLWTSDGTVAGSVPLRAFTVDTSTPAGQGVGDIVDVNGVAYFAGWNHADGLGIELWRSDGTPDGTMPTSDIIPGPASSEPLNLVDVGGEAHFVADDGVHGREIWKEIPPTAPPTPATSLTADPISAYRVSLSWQHGAQDESGFRIERSISSDFTDIDRRFTVLINATSFTDISVIPGRQYFYRVSAFNAAGGAAPATDDAQVPFDNAPPGVVQVAPQSEWFSLANLREVNERAVFTANTRGPMEGRWLVASDGTNMIPLTTTYPTIPVGVAGDSLYFPRNGLLWKTDGTPDETRRVQQYGTGFWMHDSIEFKGQLYFTFSSAGNPAGLFRTDGTAGGTVQVSPVVEPQGLTVAGDTLYFYAYDAAHGYELWKSDGTTAGTQIAADVVPGPGSSVERSTSGFNGDIEAVGDTVFFRAASALWKSDGTPGGASRVHAVFPFGLKSSGDGLYYFNASNLWKTDGTTNTFLRTFPSTRFIPGGLTPAAGRMFFTNGVELWASDGTPGGTAALRNFGAFNDPTVADLVAVAGRLYFRGSSALWTSDGTVAGTVAVPGQPTGGAGLNLASLTEVADTLYFAGNGASTTEPRRLYRYVPPPQGQAPSAPSDLTASPAGAKSGAGGVSLGWTDGSDDESGFVLQRSSSPTFAAIDKTVSLPPGATGYVDSTAPQQGQSFYRLWAYNRAGASAAVTASAGEPAPDTTPPQVTAVFVAGFAGIDGATPWSESFRNVIQSSGAGEAFFGYRIPADGQTDELPWTNLDGVSVRFSEDVNIDAGDLVLRGVRTAVYQIPGVRAFVYDPATFTATWVFNTVGFGPEKLLIDVDGDAGAGVTDAAGNLLDGEGTNPVAPAVSGDTFPSGDGTPGGDFLFRLNVLPGDVNRSGGSVIGSDVTLVRNSQNFSPGSSGYSIFRDVNGSASILGSDVTAVRNRQGLRLPAGEPSVPGPMIGGAVAMLPPPPATMTAGVEPLKSGTVAQDLGLVVPVKRRWL